MLSMNTDTTPETISELLVRLDEAREARNERMAAFPAEAREAAWAALTEAARDFETPEGTVKFDNAAYCVSARA